MIVDSVYDLEDEWLKIKNQISNDVHEDIQWTISFNFKIIVIS